MRWLDLVFAGVFLASTFCGSPPAQAADWYYWIGAGTGGNMATDPTDLTTQWNYPANWQGGIVPTPNSIAYLPLTNAGYVNAQSAALAGLFVDGTSAEGACHIADGVAITTQPGYGVFVGYEGQGRIVQTGGSLTTYGAYGGYGLLYVGGPETAGTGRYELHAGNVACDEAKVGYQGTGILEQAGGTLIVTGTMYVGVGSLAWPGHGTLNVGAGTLRVGSLYLGDAYSSAALNITDSAARIEAAFITLGPGSTLSVVLGAEIHMTKATPWFIIGSREESALADLDRLVLVFDGADAGSFGRIEAASRDLGASLAGFADNFALGTVILGASNPGGIRLMDSVDNGNRNGPEAVYLHDLTIGPGSTLDLQGLHLYYDGTIRNFGSIYGGTPIFVPEPNALLLLGAGLVALRMGRMLKRGSGPVGETDRRHQTEHLPKEYERRGD